MQVGFNPVAGMRPATQNVQFEGRLVGTGGGRLVRPGVSPTVYKDAVRQVMDDPKGHSWVYGGARNGSGVAVSGGFTATAHDAKAPYKTVSYSLGRVTESLTIENKDGAKNTVTKILGIPLSNGALVLGRQDRKAVRQALADARARLGSVLGKPFFFRQN